MSQFTTPLDVRHLDGKYWMVLQPFVYYTNDKHIGIKPVNPDWIIEVTAEFITDFASIPRIFHGLLSPTGKHGKAAVVHDFLYQTLEEQARFTRKEADQIFRDAMEVLGVPAWKRSVMYNAVRMFGGIVYRKYAKGLK